MHNSTIVVVLWNKERFRKEYIGEVTINVYDLFKKDKVFHQGLYDLVRLRSNRLSVSSVVGTLDLSFKLLGDVDLIRGWTEFSESLDIDQGYQTDSSDDGEDFEDSDEFNPLEFERILKGISNAAIDGHVSDSTDMSEDEDVIVPKISFEGCEESTVEDDLAPVERTLSLLIPKSHNNLVTVPIMTPERRRRKLGRKKFVPRGYFEFNSRSSVVGIIYLEIISATDLPPMNNMTRTGFDMDPFVVVSFGKKTFRTPWKRHTLNPVFNEKLMFPVLKHEQTYSINFAVMDKDKITLNDFVASIDFPVSNVLKHAPVPDPDTLLYNLDNLSSKNRNSTLLSGDDSSDELAEMPPRSTLFKSSDSRSGRVSKSNKNAIDAKNIAFLNDDKMIPFELPLTLTKQKYEEKHSPKLYIKARFLPYAALRQQFWRGLIKTFDTDESDSLNFFELSELLETLGSNLSERTIISYFTRFAKNVEDNELTVDELVICLENQILKDTINQQKANGELSDNQLTQPRLSTDYISGLDDDEDQEQERIIHLSACPFCNQPRLSKRAEIDIVTHLATCASQEWAVDGQLVIDKFVSSNQARKRWYTKVVSKVTYGNYRLGANSANILVQDRVTGYIQEEKMNVYVRLGIRILYKGIRSSKNMESKRARNMLKSLSIKQGRKYDNPISTRSIPSFIKFHQLDMNEVLEPIENFKTFNEFFYRKLKPGARVLDAPHENKVLVSPADCRSTYFPTISKATEIWIKGRDFSITRLFGDAYPEYVNSFVNGSLAIFRLAPQDYHRFHMPVSGVLGEAKTIEGEYYTVNPMAIRSTLDVFGENVRVLVPVHTTEFGLVMIVCVGAMMVGSTVITATEGSHLNRMDELGYFKFGGSTLVVLFEPGRVKFDTDLVNNSSGALETLVKVGMSIGHCPSIPEYVRHQGEINSEDIERAKTAIAGENVN